MGWEGEARLSETFLQKEGVTYRWRGWARVRSKGVVLEGILSLAHDPIVLIILDAFSDPKGHMKLTVVYIECLYDEEVETVVLLLFACGKAIKYIEFVCGRTLQVSSFIRRRLYTVFHVVASIP